MASVFHQQFAAVAAPMLLSHFAETVVYYPFSGEPRTIEAIIEREQVQLNPEDGDILTPVFMVHVLNDRTRGVSSDELNVGGDKIELSVRVGDKPTLRTVMRLMGHAGSMIDLECR
jgi:hypothetical protein